VCVDLLSNFPPSSTTADVRAEGSIPILMSLPHMMKPGFSLGAKRDAVHLACGALGYVAVPEQAARRAQSMQVPAASTSVPPVARRPAGPPPASVVQRWNDQRRRIDNARRRRVALPPSSEEMAGYVDLEISAPSFWLRGRRERNV
jgi:hypothetical protein